MIYNVILIDATLDHLIMNNTLFNLYLEDNVKLYHVVFAETNYSR